MTDVVIVSAVRTPTGKFLGALKGLMKALAAKAADAAGARQRATSLRGRSIARPEVPRPRCRPRRKRREREAHRAARTRLEHEEPA